MSSLKVFYFQAFLPLTNKLKVQNSHSIWYWIAISEYTNKVSFYFALLRLFILCITMMVNLPCLMASCANFLRPTYSYTECWLSFLTGSCPKEWTTASYSSCLYIWSLLTCFASQGSVFSGCIPCLLCWSCYWWRSFDTSSSTSFCSRTLPVTSFLKPDRILEM